MRSQARANRKITVMLHKRATLRSNLRLEACGEKIGMKLTTTNSATGKRMNIPRCPHTYTYTLTHVHTLTQT